MNRLRSLAPSTRDSRVHRSWSATALAFGLTWLAPGLAHADESGVSFWLPGTYGSLAAVPGAPGWSSINTFVYNPANANGSRGFPRGGQLDVGVDGTGYIDLFGASYAFASPV